MIQEPQMIDLTQKPDLTMMQEPRRVYIAYRISGRRSLIMWAVKAPIEARRDALDNTRAVLVYIAAAAEQAGQFYNDGTVQVDIFRDQIANACELGDMAVRGAIDRLYKQGYLTHIKGREHLLHVFSDQQCTVQFVTT